MRALPASSYRRLTIPLALAQRNTSERSDVTAPSAPESAETSNAAAAPSIAVSFIPSVPPELATILYDQINNPAPTPKPPFPGGVTSQDFEPELDDHDSFAADDLVVPAGQIWNISEVHVIGESSEPPAPPDSFHVFFYTDSTALPGTLVASRLANPYSGFGEFLITLTSPVTLPEGAYWVSVQAREDYSASGEWFWDNRSVISNSGAAWQNPGGGFGVGCLTLESEDCLSSNAKWARPTIPSGWDSRTGWSNSTSSPFPSPSPDAAAMKPLRHRQRC